MSENIPSSCNSRSLVVFFLSFFLALSSFGENQDPGKAGNADSAAGGAAPAANAATPAAGGGGADAAKGESLFKESGCTSCHEIFKKKVGPALKGVTKRWPSTELLVQFVRNSDKVKAQGDPYVTKLNAEYNGMAMPQHEFLSPADVTAILDYIESAPEPKAEVAATPGTPGGGGGTPGTDNSGTILGLIVVVLVLVLFALILLLIFIKRYLRDKESSLREDEKYLVEQKFEVGTFLKSRGFIGVVAFLFVCVAARSCYMGLLSVGVEQNYEPKQPIPFSHKIHAGQYKINCNYCHTGVTKSKQANIPSINICMNCHSQIQEGAVYGKAALGVLLEYNEKKRPIEWVRVHNLPDLAYFNHSQHVVAGERKCEECHGPVDSMDVVRQFSPLTMGWCINCHRETDIQLNNPYYLGKPKFKAVYDKHENLKVEDIGGLECSRCHY